MKIKRKLPEDAYRISEKKILSGKKLTRLIKNYAQDYRIEVWGNLVTEDGEVYMNVSYKLEKELVKKVKKVPYGTTFYIKSPLCDFVINRTSKYACFPAVEISIEDKEMETAIERLKTMIQDMGARLG